MTSLQQRILTSQSHRAQLLQTLAETDYATSALQTNMSYLSDLANEINRRTKQLAALAQAKDKELADHEKIQRSKVRRELYRISGRGADFMARAEKEEREYFEAVRALHQAETVLAMLKTNVADAADKHQMLKSVVAIHDATQAELEKLYDTIFKGDTPEFPEEDAKEWPTNAAKHAYNEVQLRRDTESQVLALLQEANTCIGNCSAWLSEANNASEEAAWSGLNGSRYSDMAERSQLAQAQKLAFQGEMLVSQAERLQPLVQSIGAMGIVEGHVMGDMIFEDNDNSDSTFEQIILEWKNQVMQAMRDLNVEIASSERRLRNFQFETDVARVRLEDARSELLHVRTVAFSRIVANMPPSRVSRLGK